MLARLATYCIKIPFFLPIKAGRLQNQAAYYLRNLYLF